MPYTKVNNRKIYYEVYGNGTPILFGHSFLWDRSMWNPQIEYLKKNFCCVIPDLWGHGKSDTLLESNYSLESLSKDYKEFMDSIAIESYSIVGLSIGGMWGANLALQYPEKVKKLVLMDTYLGLEPLEKQKLYLNMIDVIEKCGFIPDELIEQITPIFFSPKTLKNNNTLINDFKASLKDIPTESIETILTIGKSIFLRDNILLELSKIKVPTMIIVGKDDIARPVNEAREMSQIIESSALEIIEDSGHISNLEQPELVNNILYKFLTK